MQSTSLDAVFGALADPTRRAILARLTAGDRTVADEYLARQAGALARARDLAEQVRKAVDGVLG